LAVTNCHRGWVTISIESSKIPSGLQMSFSYPTFAGLYRAESTEYAFRIMFKEKKKQTKPYQRNNQSKSSSQLMIQCQYSVKRF